MCVQGLGGGGGDTLKTNESVESSQSCSSVYRDEDRGDVSNCRSEKKKLTSLQLQRKTTRNSLRHPRAVSDFVKYLPVFQLKM